MVIITAKSLDLTSENFEQIGLTSAIKNSKSVLIKINLARPPVTGHPRTDPSLLKVVLEYCIGLGANIAIAESADGYLQENVRAIGLNRFIEERNIKIIDLDLEDDIQVVSVDGELHYLPKCLQNYDVRIAMPLTSKRPGMIFSSNVKLFVGAVPRRFYQVGEVTTSWRPRVHVDLHRSVANIYRAIMDYAPFHYFVNGGNAIDERLGEFQLDNVYIADNGVELDNFIVDRYFRIETPGYLQLLSRDASNAILQARS